MTSKRRTIVGTSYAPMLVWNGEYHRVRIRFRNRRNISRNRGFAHVCVQNAAGFQATRRLTIERAYRGKWHSFDIGRRRLARRFMIEIEPLVLLGAVEVEMDGERVTASDD